VVSNSVADARNDKAVITGNPRVRSGGFSQMVFDSWAYKVFSAIAILAKMMIFFISIGFGVIMSGESVSLIK